MSERKGERRPRKYDGTASFGIEGKSSGSGSKARIFGLAIHLNSLLGGVSGLLIGLYISSALLAGAYFFLVPNNERLASMESELRSTRQMLQEIEAEAEQLAARYDEQLSAQTAADTYWIKLGEYSDRVSESSFSNISNSSRPALFAAVDQSEWARCITGTPVVSENSVKARVSGSLNVRAIPTGPSEKLARLHVTLSNLTEVEVFEFRCLDGWIWGQVHFGEG